MPNYLGQTPGMFPGPMPPNLQDAMGGGAGPASFMPPGLDGGLMQGMPQAGQFGGALDALGGGGGAQGGGFGGLSPDLIKKVLGEKGSPTADNIKRQRQLADMLRASAKEQMQGVQAGRIYKAPNIGNLAANVIGNFVAQNEDTRANKSSQTLGDEESDASNALYERLRRLRTLPGYSTPGITG